ncbi:dirigent protein [Pyxidicoccus parkwayensis]|uniref:Dirigent protein n=2 Tax=Pyxidicoccus parkwayensis TaxID=2813578 RepID=A0ABX7PCF3_9BACT|nr:dirigent protein [Pyxidicoccus parkwaysis]
MAAVAVLAATLLLNFSSAHAKQDTTFVTIADARSGIATPVDLGAPGDSPGDMFVFDQPLLNEARQPIGSNSGYCIRTLPGQFSECQWTLTMANGTITVAGREAETGTSLIPIIGGTGAYVGARGVLTTTPNGDRTFTQVLTLFR